jgi:hypothetical protein
MIGEIANSGDAIRLSKVEITGVATEAALPGQKLKVWTRLLLTSEDPMFHTIAESLSGVIEHSATLDSKFAHLPRATTALLVIKPDNAADLWIDTAAMILNMTTKRDVTAGSPVFENDIADVVGMDFPLAGITEQDRIICLFRVGWRFALFFDLDRTKPLDLAAMRRDLGTLFRMLRYRNVYDAVGTPAIFDRLVASGWFPFVEILGHEFRTLVNACRAGWDLTETEKTIVESFSAERLKHLFNRWIAKPHFAAKKAIFKSAIAAFKRRDAVAAIKIAVTEIEGILRAAYRARTGKTAKLAKLLEFAVKSAEEKAGASNTLFFPQAFGEYLASHTFANFDPVTATGAAGSRHAVGHGEAATDTYTQTRALQTLLTLDQLAFYT